MRHAIAVSLLLALAACAGGPAPESPPKLAIPQPDPDHGDSEPPPRPQLVRPAQPLQCVPYARQASGIEIYGDAWTWWNQAGGRYPRGHRPREGALMVLDTGRKRGHLAYVTRVTHQRRIVVDHANWLNRGQIHRNAPVVDVSKANDWSRVRVWYTPGDQLGASAYEVVGFIYPDRRTAQR